MSQPTNAEQYHPRHRAIHQVKVGPGIHRATYHVSPRCRLHLVTVKGISRLVIHRLVAPNELGSLAPGGKFFRTFKGLTFWQHVQDFSPEACRALSDLFFGARRFHFPTEDKWRS